MKELSGVLRSKNPLHIFLEKIIASVIEEYIF